ncbi:MAG TPA: DUF6603 domain-containing protein [Blastocatellia bacterium]|nr:DUF6603 domain-containing protein [Blastocatellia bacterium]
MIGSMPVNAQIEVPLAGALAAGSWALKLNSTILFSSGLQDLITFLDQTTLLQAFGLPSFSSIFPDELKQIPTIFLDEVQILLNPLQLQFQYLTFRLLSVESINYADYLLIDKVGVRVNLAPAAGASGISLFIFGTVKMGETATLDVSVLIPENFSQNNWIFMMSGEVDLESINDVELLPINTPIEELQLPDGFFTLETLNLDLFEVDFNPLQANLSTIILSVAISGACELISDLSFENPSMSLNIDDPFNQGAPPARKLTGTFAGTIQVGDISFSIDAEKQTEGWSFTGATEPGSIPIGQLISSLAAQFNLELPDFINDISLESLSLTFNTTAAETPATSGGTGVAAPQTESVVFNCEGAFPLDDQQAIISLAVDVRRVSGGPFYGSLGGELAISPLLFTTTYSQSAADNFFVAAYSHQEASRSIDLKDLIASASSTVAAYIPESLAVDLKYVLFAFSKDTTGSKLLFGLDLGTSINLSDLPLVGQAFPADEAVSVNDLQVLVASKLFEQNLITTLKSSFPAQITALPQGDLSAGLWVSASMSFGDSTLPLDLPVSGGAATNPAMTRPPATTPAATTANVAATDNAKWFTLQKSFGPVYFRRVGVQYQGNLLTFLLDASLTVGGLTLSLDGLSVGSPLDKFDPQFNLKGIGIDYKGGPVSIGSAFLRKQVTSNGQTYDEYDGAALIKTEQLTISAIGSYAYFNEQPSLFIYAVLDYPLGGPSFFFVTGLAAGFGYNRSLIMPSIDQVAKFPLVDEAINGTGNPNDLEGELRKISAYIPPTVGEMFLAIGIKFTSFKIIDSFVLLTASFGNRFELNLLGLSTLISPPQASQTSALAVVQMAIKATFLPDDGFLGVLGQLTPASYILSRDCQLTGGFAFYSWFSGPHAGDFVQTLGGYHPLFTIPDHYPRVPRLSVNWRVDSNLSIKGDAYFALTSSALMAGGSLQATWHSGDFKAYFKAAADFLVAWKPYHYDAKIRVTMGVTYKFDVDVGLGKVRKTISVDVGSDLHIWGPEFSGKAHVKLDVVSFDVTFGDASKSKPKAINWSEFKSSFLPAASQVCSLSVKAGLVKNSEDAKWIINPKDFCITVDSAIPSKEAYRSKPLAGGTQQDTPISSSSAYQKGFGIGPMAVEASNLSSKYYITILRNGTEWAGEDFQYAPVLKKVPAGLWGQSVSPSLKAPAFIEPALTGFDISPGKLPTPGETADIERENLQYDPIPIRDAYRWETYLAFAATSAEAAQRTEEIRRTITDPAVAATREQLLTTLGVTAPIVLAADDVADSFLIPPEIGTLAG